MALDGRLNSISVIRQNVTVMASEQKDLFETKITHHQMIDDLGGVSGWMPR
jgi:hypothetical protein